MSEIATTRLATLVKDINREWGQGELEIQQANKLQRQADELKESAYQRAVRIGGWFNEAKLLVKRGEWRDWLEDNFRFSHMTATRYMKIARSNITHEGSVLHSTEPSSQREALRNLQPQITHQPQEKEPTRPSELLAALMRLRAATQNYQTETKFSTEDENMVKHLCIILLEELRGILQELGNPASQIRRVK